MVGGLPDALVQWSRSDTGFELSQCAYVRSGTAGGLRTHVGGRGARAERGGADGQRSGGTGWDGGGEWAGGADGCSGGTGPWLHGTSGQVAHTACTGGTEERQGAVGATRIDCCATAMQ